MIVRDIKDIRGTSREVKGDGWTSNRLLLKSDGMGFSFHVTTIPSNTELKLHYKNHFESVYCMSGTGKIKDLKDGKEYDIYPGVIYALNENDKHILTSNTKLVFACVFNPPITGQEQHDDSGSYALEE